MFKVNNKDTRTTSKLTIKIPERRNQNLYSSNKLTKNCNLQAILDIETATDSFKTAPNFEVLKQETKKWKGERGTCWLWKCIFSM